VNSKQSTVLWIILVLIAVMGLIPPWQQRVKTTLMGFENVESTIYAPIFVQPKPNYSWYPPQYRTRPEWVMVLRKSTQVVVDVPRLAVQWTTVLLVGIGLLLLLGDPRKRELAPKERLSYIERMKRAGVTAGGSEAAVPDMALDDEDLTEDDAPTANDPKHVFSDDEL
jgi:hypothetical protein